MTLENFTDKLRRIFDYDPLTGVIKWKQRNDFKPNMNARFSGQVAGSLCKIHGYIIIGVDRKIYRAHRIIWQIVTGKEPSKEIDHIDGNRANNKWSNLREASFEQNQRNRGLNKNSTTGYKGVTFSKKDKIFIAHIRINKERKHLGCFRNVIEAAKAYNAAAINYFGDFARTNDLEHPSR